MKKQRHWVLSDLLKLCKSVRLIAEEKIDPLRKGWEPPIWKICDALLEWPWLDKDECKRIRESLGFHKPVDVLLINGGNRGGKSEFSAKRTMMMLQYVKSARAWCFHESNQNSVEYQHPLMWKYLPPDQRKKLELKSHIYHIIKNMALVIVSSYYKTTANVYLEITSKIVKRLKVVSLI